MSLAIAPDPAATCLLLVDLQVGSIAAATTAPPDRLRDSAVALATLARLHNVPAVITAGRRPGVDGAFLPELRTLLNVEPIERSEANAWEAPPLRHAVADTGRKTLLIAGVATEIGVLFGALGARQQGYEVWVAIDACAGADPEAEALARQRMAAAGVVLTSWMSLAAAWMKDFAAPASRDTLALIATRASGRRAFG